MSEREKILRFYRVSGDGDLAAKLLDTAEATLRHRKYKVSDFLDPAGYSIAETIAAHYERLTLAGNGGYRGAERVKAAFVAEDFMGSVDFGISALEAEFDARYYQISHRDVLGALMSLGVKRDLFGDIIMSDQGCQILIDSAMETFIVQNLVKIGAAPVAVTIVPLTAIVPREEKIKEIRSTVASLRLDAVAAAGFGTSRSKMADDIDADKVKVNWQDAKNAAQMIKQGDVISMRGRGRVEVSEIAGQTKKGRTSIVLKRFL